jgi:hypothetical protein
MKKTFGFISIVFVLAVVQAPAQGYAGDRATVEPTMLIDKPTAGLLKRGSFAVGANFFQQGGMLATIGVGIFEPFMIGISYGGTDIIGQNRIRMNPLPGVQARLRVFNESTLMPAIAFGFDSQGKEPFLDADSLKRYTIKSPGLYLVVSKNYRLLGNLSLHGGANMSTERSDGDSDLNIYAGAEKSLGEDLSFLAEFDLATNDDHGHALGKSAGYLNVGLRWSWGKGFVVGFDLKNITRNRDNVVVGNRTLQLDYVSAF